MNSNAGSNGPRVSALGLGCMGMSGIYGPADRGREHRHHPCRARRRHHAARYRRLLRHGPQRAADRARRCADRTREHAAVSVKFGALRDPDGGWLGYDARPAAVKNFLAYTPAAARHRLHRHLPPGAARSRRADRGHHRRHRRPGAGRLRAPHRPVRGRRARPSAAPTPSIPSPICRSSTRCCSRGIEDGDSARPAANSASASPPTACCRAG